MPTYAASAVIVAPSATPSPQSIDSHTDQSTSGTITVQRAASPITIGIVRRPMARSPSTSLKSCAWIVVRRIAVLARMEHNPIPSKRVGSAPAEQSESYDYGIGILCCRSGHTCDESRADLIGRKSKRVHGVADEPVPAMRGELVVQYREDGECGARVHNLHAVQCREV